MALAAPSFHPLGLLAQGLNPAIYHLKTTFPGLQSFLRHTHRLPGLNHLIPGAIHESRQVICHLQVWTMKVDMSPLHHGIRQTELSHTSTTIIGCAEKFLLLISLRSLLSTPKRPSSIPPPIQQGPAICLDPLAEEVRRGPHPGSCDKHHNNYPWTHFVN